MWVNTHDANDRDFVPLCSERLCLCRVNLLFAKDGEKDCEMLGYVVNACVWEGSEPLMSYMCCKKLFDSVVCLNLSQPPRPCIAVPCDVMLTCNAVLLWTSPRIKNSDSCMVFSTCYVFHLECISTEKMLSWTDIVPRQNRERVSLFAPLRDIGLNTHCLDMHLRTGALSAA